VTFTTDDQSKWGPGTASPDPLDLPFFSTSWNESDGVEYKQNFGGSIDFEGYDIPTPEGTFGGAISGSTTGEIAMGMKLEDFGAGGVAVEYPIEAILTTPAADSLNVGDTITINSSFRVLPGAELATESPSAGTVSLYGTLGFTFAMDTEVCIVDCVDFGIPTFGISPTKSGNIISIDIPERLSLDSYEIAESIVNDTIPIEVKDLIVSIIGEDIYDILLGFTAVPQLATFIDNLTPLGYFGGYVGLPDVETTSALGGDGTTLTASGEHDFVEIDIDLLGFFTSVPLGLELFPMCIGNFCAAFNINIASVESVTTLTQEEDYLFEARPRVMLQFPEPVVYNITPCALAAPFDSIDPSNPTLPVNIVNCSGTSDTIIYDLGSSVDITFPASFSGSIMNVTPTFLLPNQISNDTVTTLMEAIELTIGECALSVSAFDVVSPCARFPRAVIS
jgi:hypothetical protein